MSFLCQGFLGRAPWLYLLYWHLKIEEPTMYTLEQKTTKENDKSR